MNLLKIIVFMKKIATIRYKFFTLVKRKFLKATTDAESLYDGQQISLNPQLWMTYYIQRYNRINEAMKPYFKVIKMA